jgi:hypothetical protein
VPLGSATHTQRIDSLLATSRAKADKRNMTHIWAMGCTGLKKRGDEAIIQR